MSLKTIVKEILRMVKEKILFIIIMTVAVAVGLTAFGMMKNRKQEKKTVSVKNESLAYLEKVYDNKPATFSMIYIYAKDGTYFTNATFLDDYFSSDAFIKEFSTKYPKLADDFKKWSEAEKATKIPQRYEGRGGIFFRRDKQSNIITAYINCFKTSEDNLILAQEICQLLKEGIDLTANTTMTMLQEPKIEPEHIYPVVPESGKDAEELDPNSPINLPSEAKIAKIKARPIKTWTILGAIGGAFLSTGLVFCYYVFRNRIRYAFQYSWDVNDLHFMINMKKELDREELKNLLKASENRVVLAKPCLFDEKYEDDLLELKNMDSINRISIVIEEEKTLRSWYRKQKYIADRINASVDIIHIIGR